MSFWSPDRDGLFEPEHEDFRASFRTFLEREVVPYYDGWELDGRVPKDVFRAAAAHGFAAFSIPEQFGGAEVEDFRFNVVVNEEVCRAGVFGFGGSLTLHNDVCVPLLTQLADEQQATQWLPQLASGEILCALAVAEPDAGTGLTDLGTAAERDNDRYKITGTKTFVTSGVSADLVLTVARIDKDPADDDNPHPNHRIELFAIDGDALARVARTPLNTVGLHAQGLAQLDYPGVMVEQNSQLGDAAAALSGIEAQALLSSAVASLGAMRCGLTWTLAYVNDRKAFGTPLIQFQNTQFEIAELATSLSVAQAHIDRCIREHLAGRLTPQAAAMAKLWCSEIHANAMDRCLQLHGGYGYMHEYPIARAFRDASASRLYWGSSESLKQDIADSLGFAPASASR